MLTDNFLRLLVQRRFGGFFITQFLGAFNDNLYKNALLLLIAFGHLPLLDTSKDTLINLSAGLFILPFFIFSPMAGQLSDKYNKAKQLRLIKLIEIFIMGLGVLGFYGHHTLLLMLVLFLMGMQSAFFGPAKYSILPQHLNPSELLQGNALVEMSTFLAILLGTIAGGLLISGQTAGLLWVSIAIVTIAILGFLGSLLIPTAPASDPFLKINWNLFTEGWHILKIAKKNPIVFKTILSISWFWLYGALFLSQIPNYVSSILHANEQVATLLLTALSLGLGIGALLCTQLYHKGSRLPILWVGTLGLSLFAIDLGILSLRPITQPYWHIIADFTFMGICGGLYTVPLYTLLQTASDPKNRSRIIAANNILNALFMVLSSLLAILLLNNGLNIPHLFILMGFLNGLVHFHLIGVGRPS